MKCLMCNEWITRPPVQHKKCRHVSMCLSCYDKIWDKYEEELKKPIQVNVEVGTSAPDAVKCLKCDTIIDSRQDGIFFVEWKNNQLQAAINRQSSNEKTRKIQMKKDKKNRKRNERRIKALAKKRGSSNTLPKQELEIIEV